MKDFSELLERNKNFAETYKGNLSKTPQFYTIILTCVDTRVDPAHFLGLNLGDAFVFRKPGARVTADFEKEIGIMWSMIKTNTGDNFNGLSLAIIHHTDCGVENIAAPKLKEAIKLNTGMNDEEIENFAIKDHAQSIKNDIEQLKTSEHVPNELNISGYIYNMESGIVEEVG